MLTLFLCLFHLFRIRIEVLKILTCLIALGETSGDVLVRMVALAANLCRLYLGTPILSVIDVGAVNVPLTRRVTFVQDGQ